jgi:tetratricopeptide (TPR) repeat protein
LIDSKHTLASMGTCNHHQTNKISKLKRRSLKIDVAGRDAKRNPTKHHVFNVFAGSSTSTATSKDAPEAQKLAGRIMELNNKAVSLYNKGDFDTASHLFQEAASLRQKTAQLTIKNPPPAAAAAAAAAALKTPIQKDADPPTFSYIYQRMEFDEGMNDYTETETVHNGEHPEAVQATLLFNAGQARRKLQDYEGAARHYEMALQTCTGTSSTAYRENAGQSSMMPTATEVHRIIIPILHNVGQLSYRKGNLQEAIDAYKMALDHCRQLDGKSDYSVCVTLNCLGVLYYHLSAEKSCHAIECFHDALEIQKSVLGPSSATEATTLNNLGRVHVQREEFDQALYFYEKALAIRKQRLGTDSIDYAATAFNAGQSLHQKGDYDRAIELYKEFLRVALIKFSKNHRDIAVVLSGIAQIHQERKEYDKALHLYQESLQVGRAALGDYHSEVAMLLNRIGNFQFERENFDEALEAYSEGLKIERKVLQKSHPNIIVTISNIAEIRRQKNEFEPAIRLYTEAMELQKLGHGESSAEVAGTLNVIGLIYDQKGNSKMALKRLQEALVMRRNTLGDSHLDVSATLTYLGTIFYRKNMISTAMQLFNESLRIRRDKLGINHRDVSFTLYNLGLCYQLQGSFKEATECYKETLRVEKLVLGEGHRDVSMTMYKLGEAYKALGALENALDSFTEALAIERNTLGQEDPATVARTLNEIGNIQLARGDVIPMMEAFNEAARIFSHAGLSPNSVAVSGQLYAFDVSCPSAAPAA